jgi:hypothetical protein
MDMEIVVTSGVETTEVPEDAAKDFAEAYEALAKLPVNRMINVNFKPENYPATEKQTSEELAAKAARQWVRQGKAWAANTEVVLPITDADGNVTGSRTTHLVFVRKGDVKGNPTRVSFRVYAPRPGKDEASE